MKTAACAALAVAGVQLLPGTDPLTVSAVVAGLCSGAAGNVFHELLGEGESELSALFARRGAIDANHHVLLALREAHLRALATIVKDYAGDEPSSFDQSMRTYLVAAGSTKGGAAATAGALSAFEETLFARMGRGFDAAIAARGADAGWASDAEAAAARAAVEDAVLAVVAIETGVAPPADFVAMFRGSGSGWFDLFVRDAADRLKTNDSFRTIWQSEKLASVVAEVQRIAGTLKEINETTKRIEEKVDDLGEAFALIKDEIREFRMYYDSNKVISLEIDSTSLMGSGSLNSPNLQYEPLLFNKINHINSVRPDDNFYIEEDKIILLRIDALRNLLEDTKHYDRAIIKEKIAIENRLNIEKGRASIIFEIALMQRMMLDHCGSIQSLREGLRLDSSNYQKWIELGDELRLTGDTSGAAEAYRAANEIGLAKGQ